MEHSFNLGVLFILGLGVFGGMLGAWFFQRIKFPQVVGYIVIGLIIGESGLKLVRSADIEALRPFNMFALGIIGLLVGGELRIDTFKKYARSFTAILLGEGLLAFLIVGALSFAIIHYVTGSFVISLATCIVFGAIASATDPASTIDVLWEYRSRGVLTTSLTAIVALDDALAMTLYGLGTSVARVLTSEGGSMMSGVLSIGVELFGSFILGTVFAMVLIFLLRWLHQPEKSLALALGLMLLAISLAVALQMDVILATMTIGFVLANYAERRSAALFKMLKGFSVPIYVLFFVLVGARLGLSKMPFWLITLVLLYVIGRSIGKWGGAWLGAKITHSDDVVRRYLGLGLMAQGGVAIGLSIMASQHLGHIQVTETLSLGEVIIFAVTATTLIVQLIGPPMVKVAIKLAGETGRNVTEEDIIESWTVADVIEGDIVTISESDSLLEVVDIFVNNEFTVYPIVNEKQHIVGMINMTALKSVMNDRDSWQWLLASDVMEPPGTTLYPDMPLNEAINQMTELNLDQVAVVGTAESQVPVGVVSNYHIRKRVSEELIKRQEPGRMGTSLNEEKEPVIIDQPTVEDVDFLVYDDLRMITPDAKVLDAVLLLINRPQCRFVYVSDKRGKFCGSVRMNDIMRKIVPVNIVANTDIYKVIRTNFEAILHKKVQDILDPDTEFVRKTTKTGIVLDMLTQNRSNELPVLDADQQLVGQINVYEMISAFIEEWAQNYRVNLAPPTTKQYSRSDLGMDDDSDEPSVTGLSAEQPS
ncbi:MAG: CBS domain-containing protein [Spartobacteria bacterium]|nr:CBS domain-containing protein [Spartobacteria bacterium]